MKHERSGEQSARRTVPAASDQSVGHRRRAPWLAHVFAVGAVLITLALRLGFASWVGERPFLVAFFIPIILSAYWGGRGPGLTATVVAATGTYYFLVPPSPDSMFGRPLEVVQWLVFVTGGVLICVLSGSLHRLRRRDESALEQLRDSQQALRESEELFSKAFRLSPDCVVIVRVADGTVVRANEALCRLWGRTPEEVVGRPTAEFADWFNADDRVGVLRALHQQGEGLNHETTLRLPDGRSLIFNVSSRVIMFQSAPCILSVMRDITDARKAEEARRATEARYQTLFEYAPDGILIADGDSNYIEANPSVCRMLGYTRAELTRLHASDIVAPKEIAHIAPALDTIKSKADYHREWQFRRKDGSLFDAEVMATAMPDGSLLGMIRDVTEKQQANAALREAHAQLNHLVARSPTVIYQLKLSGADIQPYFVSENVETLLGYSPAQSLDRQWWRDHIHPDDQTIVSTSLLAALTQGASRVEYRVRHQNGTYLWLEDRKRLLSPPGEEPVEIVGGWTDITSRRQTEEVAREIEERFRQVVESIHEVFWMMDVATHRVLYVSPGYEEIWGRPAESLYASESSWEETIHPEDRARALENVETRRLLGTYDETFRIVRPDGTVRWVRDRAYPVRNAEGRTHRIAGVAEDVTAEREMKAMFLRAQRLEAIGTLSSGIAHDLNNILAPILMASGLVRSELREPRSRELMTMIETSAQRGANIIRQLLTFSRGIEGQRVTVQIRHLTREMAEIARETFPRSINVTDETGADLRTVLADATQLHQVIMNLCVNARDAMPAGGQLTLRAENVELTAANLPIHAEAKTGSYVLLTVADSGTGIPPEIIDRIFDPFFTTKGVGKGTGLGLSTALGIVRSHGGFITVRSAPNTGTAFHVYLPADTQGNVAAPVKSAIVPQLGQGELILLVDDEEAVLQATKDALEAWNYRVVLATNGAEGLAVFHARQGQVKIAIVDLMMPVMDGIELIGALRASAPALKIIAVTGMEAGENRAQLRALGVAKILMKPYPPLGLVEAIAALLVDSPKG